MRKNRWVWLAVMIVGVVGLTLASVSEAAQFNWQQFKGALLRNVLLADEGVGVRVIETLRELIAVIQEELDRRQGGEGGDGDGQEGEDDENLLPTSAELKMLRSLQTRVNARTSTF